MKDQEVMRKGKWIFFLNNKEVTEKEYRAVYPLPEQGGVFAGPALSGWPLISDALKVHPKQIELAKKMDKDRGVHVDYTSAGQPIFQNREHRRQFLRAHGKIDRNSYTGY